MQEEEKVHAYNVDSGGKAVVAGLEVIVIGPKVDDPTDMVLLNCNWRDEPTFVRIPKRYLPEDYLNEMERQSPLEVFGPDIGKLVKICSSYHEGRDAQQFQNMLYDTEGQPCPHGYNALVDTQKTTTTRRVGAGENLIETAESFASKQEDNSVMGQMAELFFEAAVFDFIDINERYCALNDVLREYYTRGGRSLSNCSGGSTGTLNRDPQIQDERNQIRGLDKECTPEERQHPLANKPLPYQRAYNVGKMLDGKDRSDWPGAFRKLEEMYAKQYGELSGHMALRRSLRGGSYKKGQPFFRTLSQESTAEDQRQAVFRTCKLCHDYYCKLARRNR